MIRYHVAQASLQLSNDALGLLIYLPSTGIIGAHRCIGPHGAAFKSFYPGGLGKTQTSKIGGLANTGTEKCEEQFARSASHREAK